jgi:hypothetical protein
VVQSEDLGCKMRMRLEPWWSGLQDREFPLRSVRCVADAAKNPRTKISHEACVPQNWVFCGAYELRFQRSWTV